MPYPYCGMMEISPTKHLSLLLSLLGRTMISVRISLATRHEMKVNQWEWMLVRTRTVWTWHPELCGATNLPWSVVVVQLSFVLFRVWSTRIGCGAHVSLRACVRAMWWTIFASFRPWRHELYVRRCGLRVTCRIWARIRFNAIDMAVLHINFQCPHWFDRRLRVVKHADASSIVCASN